MFLSEWREFPSAPCLAGKKKLDDSARLDVVEIARVPDMLPSLFPFLVGLLTYQDPGNVAAWFDLRAIYRLAVQKYMKVYVCSLWSELRSEF